MDSILGLFHMLATRSIDNKMSEVEFEELADAWDEFLRQEICMWRDFYNYWALEPLIPTYIVRLEDLYEEPRSTLTELFKFILNTKSIDGTLIQHIINEETKDSQKYVYRNAPGYSFEKYTSDQIDFIKSQAGLVLLRFGYVKGRYGSVSQLTTTDYFEDDNVLRQSEKYEVDTIVRNHTETLVKVRHFYDDLNKEQLSTVVSGTYCQRLLNKELSDLELNLESENLRTKDGFDRKPNKIIRKHRQRVKETRRLQC